jgi:hypothetical protein
VLQIKYGLVKLFRQASGNNNNREVDKTQQGRTGLTHIYVVVGPVAVVVLST